MTKSNLLCLLLLLIATSSHANSREQWECALDLQQGDKGSMTLNRSEASVSGAISFDRNGSEFTQELEGRWLNREIELKRFLNSTSNQTMHGIAIRVGTKQVKMGGRYAEGLNSVWSADCDLISIIDTKSEGSSDKSQTPVPPSLSSRATPFKPSSRDKIQFAAQAFHPDGIESITFFLNDKSIHRCESKECRVTHGALKAGEHQWHVIAKSKTGAENTKRTNKLLVDQIKRSGSCAISGIATGQAAAQSNDVIIRISGGAGGQTINKSSGFDAGTYRFEGLPAGSYVVSIDVPKSLGILVSPTTKQLDCDDTQSLQQNFEFQ